MQLLDGKGDECRQSSKIKELQKLIGSRPRWMHFHRGGGADKYTANSETSALARLFRCELGAEKLMLGGVGGSGKLHMDKLLRLGLHQARGITGGWGVPHTRVERRGHAAVRCGAGIRGSGVRPPYPSSRPPLQGIIQRTIQGTGVPFSRRAT